MAELIRGLLERGLADPQGLEEIGSKVIRPSRIVSMTDTAPSETGPVHAVPKVITAITLSSDTAATIAERLHKARLSTGLKAGKIINEMCQHFDIPAEIRLTVRRQLHDAALGNTAAEPLSQIAIDAALKWLEIKNV